jgi:hypothetical protein
MKAFDPKLHGVLDQTLLEVGIVEIIRANASPGYEDRVPAAASMSIETKKAREHNTALFSSWYFSSLLQQRHRPERSWR